MHDIEDLQKEHEEKREDILENLRSQEHEINFYITTVQSLFTKAEIKKLREMSSFDQTSHEWVTPNFYFDKASQRELPTLGSGKAS
jgi:hypothetical protein